MSFPGFSILNSKRARCPACGRPIPIEAIRVAAPFSCIGCRTHLSVKPLYRRLILLLAAAISFWAALIVSSGALFILCWPVFCFFALIFIPNILKVFLPPGLILAADYDPHNRGFFRRNLSYFLTIWLTIGFSMIITGAFFGLGGIAVGASSSDLHFLLDVLTSPVHDFGPAFVLTTRSSFLTVCSVIFANAFFWTLLIGPVTQFVHAMLHRSRVTELGLSGSTVLQDDDDQIEDRYVDR